MRRIYGYAGFGMALGFCLSACDMTDLKSADADAKQPATEETVVGVWRANIPLPSEPPMDMKVTMQIDGDHTMLTSRRIATGQPSPYDFVEVAKERWTWKLVDGSVVSEKTVCEYKDPQTMEPAGTACTAPTTETAAVNVKGAVWTVVKAEQVLLFRKD